MPAGPGQILGSRVDSNDNFYMMDVTSEGAVLISGGVSLEGGSVYILEDIPTSDIYNNPAWEFGYITSGTATGVTGSSVGSIFMHVGTGSYCQVITWSDDLVTNVGSFS